MPDQRDFISDVTVDGITFSVYRSSDMVYTVQWRNGWSRSGICYADVAYVQNPMFPNLSPHHPYLIKFLGYPYHLSGQPVTNKILNEQLMRAILVAGTCGMFGIDPVLWDQFVDLTGMLCYTISGMDCFVVNNQALVAADVLRALIV